MTEHFRYWNDVVQSDIFVSDIGITDVDVDVGCRISPTLRSMSMPTYAYIQYLACRRAQAAAYGRIVEAATPAGERPGMVVMAESDLSQLPKKEVVLAMTSALKNTLHNTSNRIIIHSSCPWIQIQDLSKKWKILSS